MTTITYTPVPGYTPVSLTLLAQTYPAVLVDGVWTFTFPTPADGAYPYSVLLAGLGGYSDEGTITFPITPPVLVTADMAYETFDFSEDDRDEVERYCAAALDVVQNLCGQTLIRQTFTEDVCGTKLLKHWPVVSATLNDTVLTVTGDTVTGYGTVVYTAGLPEIPVQAVDAALIYVGYRYRRNHGGSESFMPAGVDGAINMPMGIKTLTDQMRFALGSYARGPSVA